MSNKGRIYITLAVLGIILFATATRFIPHTYNFAPLGAIALFAGAYLRNKWLAVIIPFLALFVSDALLNTFVYNMDLQVNGLLYDGWYWNYLAYGLTAIVGMTLLKKKSFGNVLMGSFSATALFFIISNFGAWLASPVYLKNINGLYQAYLAGIPFLGGTFSGNLIWCAVLFGSMALITRKVEHSHVIKA